MADNDDSDNDAVEMVSGKRVRLQLQKPTYQITQVENSDSVVNFVYKENIYGSMGILDAAGDSVKQEYDDKRLQENPEDDVKHGVVMTTAGNLPYKAIFHVQVFRVMAKFKAAIHRALRLADKEKMRSIAFPTLECTNGELVDNFLKVLYEFEKSSKPISLHLIDIISSSEEDYEYYDLKTTEMGETC